jgi:hypothetical protein
LPPFTLLAALALASGASAAERVELRSDCPRDAGDTCFGDLGALDHWLWQQRKPSAAAPVTVEVGAGAFRGRIDCRGQGHVTFRGQGRAQSQLVGTVDEFPFATIRADGCVALRFEHLSVLAPRSHTGRGKAVRWLRGGDSHWSDVALEAEYIAWYDSGCAPGNDLASVGEHRFEHVSIRAGALGYFSDCGHGWLADSEIVVAASATTVLPTLARELPRVVAGVKASHRSRVELRGCRVSVDSMAAARVGQTVGLVAGAGGNEHPLGSGLLELHGGLLRVLGSSAAPVFGARADRFGQRAAPPARVRVLGATLELRRGGVPVEERSAGDGVVEWRAGASP